MSCIPYTSAFGDFGYGYNGLGPMAWSLPRFATEIEPATGNAKPATGQQTKTQNTFAMGGVGGIGLIGYSGCKVQPPLVYRLMDKHNTLALAKFLVVAPILAGTRSFEVKVPAGGTKRKTPAIGDGVQKDPLDQRKDWLCDTLTPLLPELVRESLDALSMGNAPFEVVLDLIDGRWTAKAFHSLLPEWTQILIYPGGDFAGLRQGDVTLIGAEAFNFANDPLARNWYGTSRHENVREEWWEKLQAKIKGAELDQKASGRQGYIMGPPGTGRKDGQGNAIDGADGAEKIAASFASGGTPFMPKFIMGPPDENHLGDPVYCEAYAKIGSLLAYEVKAIDWGDTAPHALAILQKIGYIDKELMRGWRRPEREALESQTGGLGQSDSGTHGQIGVTDCDLVHGNLCTAISRGIIDNLLVLNDGEDARGSVYLQPAPLQDAKKEMLGAFLTSLMTDKGNAEDVYRKTDKEKLFGDLEIPAREGMDLNEDPPPPPPPPPVMPGQTPPKTDPVAMLSQQLAFGDGDALTLGNNGKHE